MKKKKLWKKSVSLLMLLFIVSEIVFFNVQADSSQKSELQSELENSVSAYGSNSFGTMLSDVINDTVGEQQNNNGFNIFSVTIGEDELLENEAKVSFETINDCTIVVALYDEAGKKLLSTGNIDVYKGETIAVVEIEADIIPEYFYLKAYMIDRESLRPLSTVYESPNYTQEMKEFFAKTTDDFDADRILNLDDSTDNNFAVYSEETKVIEGNKDVNIVTDIDEANKRYVIDNADETIISLKAGDIFAYEYEKGNVLIVNVKAMDLDGTTAVIYGTETSMEDVFDYVKIEDNADTSEAIIDDSNLEDGVTCNGLVDDKDEIQTYAVDFEEKVSKAVEIKIKEKKIGEEDANAKASITGNVLFKAGLGIKVYITKNYQYFEVKIDYSAKVGVSATGKLKGSIPFVTIGFMPVPGIIVEFTPSFVVELSAKIEISGTLSGAIGFRVAGDGTCDNLTSTPNFVTSIKIEGTFFIGISLEPKVKVLCDSIAKASMTVEAGAEINVSKTWGAESSSKKHDCKNCLDGNISAVLKVSFNISLLNMEKLTFKKDAVNIKIKICDFYYSFDYNEFAFTACPHIAYKVTVYAIDYNGKYVENAIVNNKYITNEKGYVELYLPSGDYPISVVKGEESGKKDISVGDVARKIIVYILKNGGTGSGSEESGNGDNKGDVEENNNNNKLQLSINESTSGYITEEGELYMWGRNRDGGLGDGTKI